MRKGWWYRGRIRGRGIIFRVATPRKNMKRVRWMILPILCVPGCHKYTRDRWEQRLGLVKWPLLKLRKSQLSLQVKFSSPEVFKCWQSRNPSMYHSPSYIRYSKISHPAAQSQPVLSYSKSKLIFMPSNTMSHCPWQWQYIINKIF